MTDICVTYAEFKVAAVGRQVYYQTRQGGSFQVYCVTDDFFVQSDVVLTADLTDFTANALPGSVLVSGPDDAWALGYIANGNSWVSLQPAIKGAATSPLVADPALTVTISPNSTALLAKIAGYLYSSYSPDNSSYPVSNQTQVSIDAARRLETHSTTTSDEGSFRDDFPDGALTVAVTGTLGFTNGSAVVTGTGTAFTAQLSAGQWLKKTSDSETLYAQISSVSNDTTVFLETGYTGTTASGVAGVVSNWLTVTPAGGSLTVANSLVSITSGTTNGAFGSISRVGDYLPYTFQVYASITQRIANQTSILGFMDAFVGTAKQAVVQFIGATNTQVNFVTSFGAAAADTQTTAVTLPGGATTAALNLYKIDISGNQATLSINGIIVAVNSRHIPGPYDALNIYAGITNSAVVTTTTLAVDYIYFYNTDRVQIDNDFQSEPMSINGSGSAGQPTVGNPVVVGGSDGTNTRSLLTDALGRLQVVTPTRNRVSIVYQAVATATADTLLSLVKSTNGTVAAGATTIPVAANKTLRITSMTFSVKANAAAAAFASYNVRCNPTGAAVIGSQSEFRVDLGNTEAVAGGARSITVPVPDGVEFSGTMQIAVSASAQAITNILSVTLTGYEY